MDPPGCLPASPTTSRGRGSSRAGWRWNCAAQVWCGRTPTVMTPMPLSPDQGLDRGRAGCTATSHGTGRRHPMPGMAGGDAAHSNPPSNALQRTVIAGGTGLTGERNRADRRGVPPHLVARTPG